MRLQEPDSFHAELSTHFEVRGSREMMRELRNWMFEQLEAGEVITVSGGESGPYWYVFNVINEDAHKVTKWLEEHGCNVNEWTK
jgi:hypothetical protein